MPEHENPLHGRRSTDADLAVIVQRLDEQDKVLARIFDQTARTNGRVSALEIAKATEEAVRKDRAVNLREKSDAHDKRRDRIMMGLAGGCGMLSSVVGYVFLAFAHIHP